MGYPEQGLTIGQLVQQAFATAVDKGWHDEGKDPTFGESVALAHSELSEALEAFRDRGYDAWRREDGKPEGVMSELADVLIRIGDTVGQLTKAGVIPVGALEQALEDKLAYNKTRPRRHGGKRL